LLGARAAQVRAARPTALARGATRVAATHGDLTLDPAIAAIRARAALLPKAEARTPRGLDAAWAWALGFVPRLLPRTPTLKAIARSADDERVRAEGLEDSALDQAIGDCRARFRLGTDDRAAAAHAIGIIAEAARRTLGLRAHREQLMGAAGLGSGVLVEMATGEGKTLVAAIAGVLSGWRDRGCHVFTANDYLARRDAEWAAPLFARCSLSVGFVIDGMDPAERQAMYARSAVYTTGREAAADFLRDALVIRAARRGGLDGPAVEDLLLNPRGLRVAIVDEADSILIDEAVTPLILSGPGGNPAMDDAVREADRVASVLTQGGDFMIDQRYREVRLTRAGRERIRAALADRGPVWAGARRREELITSALHARALMIRDREYVIHDQRVTIVDEFTGRMTPDRTWRDGMHQAVEAKEGLALRPPTVTHARISFQRFFRLYPRLSGMTGTAREAAGELWRTYRLPVVRVPTNRPIMRKSLGVQAFHRSDAKWSAIASEVGRIHATGRPILVGTRSVAASERLSALLDARGLPHAVLNAVRHAEEADVISRAGERSAITVATNMAGRGTDIRLADGVADLGGLHVISTERHESRRIDRQLAGRAGRQGDPGTVSAFCAADDDLVVRHAGFWRRLVGGRLIQSIAARRAEHSAARARARVLRQDDWLDDSLGFAGAER